MSPDPVAPSDRTPRRAVAPLLSGGRARRLFALLGWELPDTRSVRAVGQVRPLPRGVLGRLGHGPLQLRTTDRTAVATASRRLLVATAGSATLTTSEGGRVRISAGEVALLSDGVGLLLETDEEFLRYEYLLPAERLPQLLRTSLHEEVGLPVPRHAVQPFIALAGAILLSSEDRLRPRSAMHLQEALDHTAAAIIPYLAGAPRPDLTPREAQLISAAEQFVLAHAHERGFTVQHLAEGLGVSRAWLYRVFAKQGMSPSNYLRTHRRH